MKRIEVLGLQTVPEIEEGNDLAQITVECAAREAGGIKPKDIVVITTKVVSKALGLFRKLSDVEPSARARAISRRTGKDAKWVQMIFDEDQEIIAVIPLKGIISRHILDASEDAARSQKLCESEQAVFVTQRKDGCVGTGIRAGKCGNSGGDNQRLRLPNQ